MVTVTIHEKEARQMLMECLTYNEALLRESNLLARRIQLSLSESKRYKYLGREINRSARAAIELKNEIDTHWGDPD